MGRCPACPALCSQSRQFSVTILPELAVRTCTLYWPSNGRNHAAMISCLSVQMTSQAYLGGKARRKPRNSVWGNSVWALDSRLAWKPTQNRWHPSPRGFLWLSKMTSGLCSHWWDENPPAPLWNPNGQGLETLGFRLSAIGAMEIQYKG